jgi:hypothetical protein
MNFFSFVMRRSVLDVVEIFKLMYKYETIHFYKEIKVIQVYTSFNFLKLDLSGVHKGKSMCLYFDL